MRSSAAKSKVFAISGEVKTPLFSDAAATETLKKKNTVTGKQTKYCRVHNFITKNITLIIYAQIFQTKNIHSTNL